MKIKIDWLNGNGNIFTEWKYQISQFLDAHGLLHHTVRVPAVVTLPTSGATADNTRKLEEYNKWLANDKIVKLRLTSSVDRSLIKLLMTKNNSHEIWTALVKHFEGEGSEGQNFP